MMLDLSDAFDDATTYTVTHERDGAGVYDANGYWTDGAAVTTQITASIQPLSAREFQNLPEGIRNEAQAKVISQFALRSGDRLIDGTDRYKVLSVDDWQKLGGYTRAILGALR